MRKPPPPKKAGKRTGRRRFDGALWDIATGANQLGVTEKALRSQIARGLIPYRRLGGRIVFLRDEVTAFLRQLPGVDAQTALANVAARHPEGSVTIWVPDSPNPRASWSVVSRKRFSIGKRTATRPS